MNTDDTTMLIRGAIGLIAATVAYLWALSYEQRFGVRPMKTRPWGWALFCFFLIPVGVLALLFTEGNAHRRRPTVSAVTPPEPTGKMQTPDYWQTPVTPGTPDARSAIPGQTILPGGTTAP